MKTKQSIIRGLRGLLYSIQMTALERIQSLFWWFRPPGNQAIQVIKTILKKRQLTNSLKQITMKMRIRLLRWLSLLQFPALPGGVADKLSHFTLFRLPPAFILTNTIYKTLKYKPLNY